MLINKQQDGSILLTAPVMIPNKPDCDFNRGEPPLTVEQIKGFKESYNKYQFVDQEHELKRNGRIIGEPVDSYILSSDKSMEVYDGSIETYPQGTWMLTTHITEPQAIQNALNGGYTGYSPSVMRHDLADKYLSALKSQITEDENVSLKSYSQSGLIKNIVDPVVLTVSLVKKPCQTGSKFCKLKGEKMSDDAMTIKNKVLKAIGMTEEAETEALKSQVETLEDKIDNLKKENDEALKSMKSELSEIIGTAIAEALKPPFSDKSGDDSEDDSKNDDNSDDGKDDSNKKEDDDSNKKHDDGSKSHPNHDGADKSQKTEDTYKFMGRSPDGLRKRNLRGE